MADPRRASKLSEFVAHNAAVNCVTIGRKSGRLMATGGDDRKVNVWAVGKADPMMSLSGHTTGVEAVRFDNPEEFVAAGSASGTIKLWDLEKQKIVRTLTGHKSSIRALDFHPYGEFIASGSLDTNVKVWDVRRKGCIQTYKGHREVVNCLRFSPDGHWLVSGSDDGTVKLWDLIAGKALTEFTDHSGAINTIEFHPSEFLLASGSGDRTCKFWDLETFACVSTTSPEAGAVRSIAFEPNEGTALFSGGRDSLRVHAWEPHDMLDSFPVGWGRVGDMYCADGARLVAASCAQETVSVWVADLTRINTDRARAKPAAGIIPSASTVVEAQIEAADSARATSTTVATSSSSRRLPPAAAVLAAKGRQAKPASARRPKQQQQRQPKDEDVEDIHIEPFGRAPKIQRSPPPVVRAPPASAAGQTITLSKAPLSPPSSSSVTIPGGSTSRGSGEEAEAAAAAAAKKEDAAAFDGSASSASASLSHSRHREWNRSVEKPIIPSTRERPLDLDIAAFLPAPSSKPAHVSNDLAEAEVLELVASGHTSVMTVMQSRLKNLKIVGHVWQAGDTRRAMEELVDLEDSAALVDVLNQLQSLPGLWKLDLAVTLLPTFDGLLSSPYDDYVIATCNAVTTVIKALGDVILTNVRSPPPRGNVDISREERYEKCSICYENLVNVKQTVANREKDSGRVGTTVRKLLKTMERF